MTLSNNQTDNETLQMKVPLCGVLSVHLRYPQEDFVILGCDMPLMEAELLKELLTYHLQHPD